MQSKGESSNYYSPLNKASMQRILMKKCKIATINLMADLSDLTIDNIVYLIKIDAKSDLLSSLERLNFVVDDLTTEGVKKIEKAFSFLKGLCNQRITYAICFKNKYHGDFKNNLFIAQVLPQLIAQGKIEFSSLKYEGINADVEKLKQFLLPRIAEFKDPASKASQGEREFKDDTARSRSRSRSPGATPNLSSRRVRSSSRRKPAKTTAAQSSSSLVNGRIDYVAATMPSSAPAPAQAAAVSGAAIGNDVTVPIGRRDNSAAAILVGFSIRNPATTAAMEDNRLALAALSEIAAAAPMHDDVPAPKTPIAQAIRKLLDKESPQDEENRQRELERISREEKELAIKYKELEDYSRCYQAYQNAKKAEDTLGAQIKETQHQLKQANENINKAETVLAQYKIDAVNKQRQQVELKKQLALIQTIEAQAPQLEDVVKGKVLAIEGIKATLVEKNSSSFDSYVGIDGPQRLMAQLAEYTALSEKQKKLEAEHKELLAKKESIKKAKEQKEELQKQLDTLNKDLSSLLKVIDSTKNSIVEEQTKGQNAQKIIHSLEEKLKKGRVSIAEKLVSRASFFASQLQPKKVHQDLKTLNEVCLKTQAEIIILINKDRSKALSNILESSLIKRDLVSFIKTHLEKKETSPLLNKYISLQDQYKRQLKIEATAVNLFQDKKPVMLTGLVALFMAYNCCRGNDIATPISSIDESPSPAAATGR